ncbi:CTD small phosphatase-like protein 1 [Cyclospora cayetanensis]|uniref:CTD small phosphatase-like protein 1 n=1 Tax=Cyclospora cayetanensis TaxID=88456 RepID=A0A6P6RUH3_9EIME|nr:CTD small phosphatase-like protein 1 [Cyclospora cayetanensis]
MENFCFIPPAIASPRETRDDKVSRADEDPSDPSEGRNMQKGSRGSLPHAPKEKVELLATAEIPLHDGAREGYAESSEDEQAKPLGFWSRCLHSCVGRGERSRNGCRMFRWKASKRNADPQKINPPTNLIPFLPPQLFKDRGKKTLVVDLDETLVRSTFKRPSRYTFVVKKGDEFTDFAINGHQKDAWVFMEWLALFLDEVSKWFELVIFTASVGMYADLVVDKIDPKNRFTWRLYREYCTYLNGTYVKDLSLLGRDLCNVIIVDNSTQAYLWHAENAIPITSWIDDPHDTELIDIIPILSSLAMVKDIRPVIRDALLNLG